MNAVVEHTNGWVSFVERAMSNDSYSVEKLQALLEVRDRERANAAQRAFNLAMSRVDGEIGPVIRDRLNPGVNRKYATLEAIDAVARPVYSANGISVRFGCAQAPLPGWMRITCTVSHAEGYSETNYLDVPADVATRGRTPVQGVGANITYARRYLLQMCFNIVLADDDDDDDGEASRRPAYREAAASMPRGERVADPAVYDTPARPTAQRTDEQWRIWLTKLRDACAVLYHRQEVVEVGERASVGDAMATGPEWVRREISGILAENYKRFGEDDPEGEEPAEMETAEP
jgi:hypothetical protein